jgi:mRNA interferase MazF
VSDFDEKGREAHRKSPAIGNKPAWVPPQIKAAPKIRQIYWCEYWKDARLPEMWKLRPVIVVSYKNTLSGPCLVVPVSTEAQDDNRWARRLSISIEGDGVISWAVCNHPTTVSPSRFKQFNNGIPLLPKADFNQVLEKLMKWLPQPFSLES